MRRGSIRRCRRCSTDLQQRGLLRSTLVVAIGEFGRTPRINDKAGRDHWEHCYTALIAGGGVRGGQVIGESDAPRRTARMSPGDARGSGGVDPCTRSASPANSSATLGINIGGHVIRGVVLNDVGDAMQLTVNGNSTRISV